MEFGSVLIAIAIISLVAFIIVALIPQFVKLRRTGRSRALISVGSHSFNQEIEKLGRCREDNDETPFDVQRWNANADIIGDSLLNKINTVISTF